MDKPKIKNILISGSLIYDRIMDYPGYFKDQIMPDKIHVLNVAFVVNGVKESFGGTAGNIAYNLNLLGERSTILATAGKDFGEYKNWLSRNKTNLKELKIIKNQNTASVILITDQDDNQITAVNPGAMNSPRGRFNKKYLKNSLAIISPGNCEDMLNYAKLYKAQGVRYIFDPGQQITSLEPSALRIGAVGSEILIGNDYEIELIRRKVKWTTKQLFGKIKTLIITKSSEGSEIYTAGKKAAVKAVRIKKALDPTGAGDAYRAGLIKGIINGLPLEDCAKLASAVASFAVESYGTQNHKFTLKQCIKRLEVNY
jgi:adenosine kinase